jgi:hypothetical protein
MAPPRAGAELTNGLPVLGPGVGQASVTTERRMSRVRTFKLTVEAGTATATVDKSLKLIKK